MTQLCSVDDITNATREYTMDDAVSDTGLEPAMIKAIAEVESKRAAFDKNGMPTILFEPHKFKKYSGGRYDKTHPHLSASSGFKYGLFRNQRKKLAEAMSLDWYAAHMACSWGKYQIMGFNFKLAGFDSLQSFIYAAHHSEGEHLRMLINFLINTGLIEHLKNLDFDKFSKGYNGKNYKQNRHARKMRAAYNKHKRLEAIA
ncbi:MAG: N-acetylmuramidase family protein [Pseudomonadota bacterium]